MMANLGMGDTLILMVLALVVFGPRRLPQIGRQIGKLMYEFRKASNDFKFQMEEELRNAEEADRRKKEEEERQRALPPPRRLRNWSSGVASPETGAAHSKLRCSAYFRDRKPLPQANRLTPPSKHRRPRAAAPPATEPAVPRIQPPSTGETVAAERRAKAPESANSEAATPGA